MPDFSSANDSGDDGSGGTTSGFSQFGASFLADVGLLARFNLLKFYKSRENNMSAALVMRNMGIPSKGDPVPSVLAAGIAYKPIRPLTLAFDFSLPLNFADVSLSEKPYWAVGIDIAVAKFLSMRTGLLGKQGAYRFTMGSAVNFGKIALDLNYSLDLMTQFTPLNRVSLAVRFNFGDQGRKAASDKVDALYLAGVEAYSAGRYDEARQHWQDALDINPRFDPAKEGIALVGESDKLSDRMLNMQSLDF
jgi:tetratricopeptide (TPR) repeat protein